MASKRINKLKETKELSGYFVIDTPDKTYKYNAENIKNLVHNKYLPLSGGTISGKLELLNNVTIGSTLNYADNNSISIGDNTIAIGEHSYAEGGYTSATNIYAHAEGEGTIALGESTHVQGTYNTYDNADMLFVIGNGTDENNRSDAMIVDDLGIVSAAHFYDINGEIKSCNNYVQNTTAFL